MTYVIEMDSADDVLALCEAHREVKRLKLEVAACNKEIARLLALLRGAATPREPQPQ